MMILLRHSIILLSMALALPSSRRKSSNNAISNRDTPPLLFAYANAPPTSSSPQGFNRKRNHQKSSDASTSNGLTLGDLEFMQQPNGNIGDTFIPTTESIFGPRSEVNPRQNVQTGDGGTRRGDDSSHQQRRSLRRINLDLSGRVMCHLLSPTTQNDDGNDDDVRGSSATAVQMSSTPLFQFPTTSRLNSSRKTLRRLYRYVPHIYIGANYDLDEVWYGATRWIAKCSWQLPMKNTRSDGSRRRNARRLLVQDAYNSIFPTTTTNKEVNKRLSAWMIDLEGEQSVFDHSDSTARVSLVHHRCQTSTQRGDLPFAMRSVRTKLQKVSMEYDSTKYSINPNINSSSPTALIAQAPTISLNIQTPILHPRIELHAKKTWIVQRGGDRHGNYYGGTHHESICSPVDRRLETIRERYNSFIPWSQNRNMNSNNNNCNDSSSSSSSSTTTTIMGRIQTIGRKFSNWLEEDRWMPKRVTADLAGNFVTVNEVGFRSTQSSSSSSSNKEDEREHSFPTMQNMAIRLRITKRIKWTSLGIFPWSSNNCNQNNNTRTKMPETTCVRLEVCQLHKSGNAISQIGCNFDPFDSGNTFKVVIGHDGVA